MVEIVYKTDILPTPEQVIKLYDLAGLPRPTNDPERIRKMYAHSTLVITAWDNAELIGVARSITDWAWCCYLADLAVNPNYQKSGMGKKLIGLTKEKVGEQSMILLLSVPGAMTYYPKVGFEKEDRGFLMKREK